MKYLNRKNLLPVALALALFTGACASTETAVTAAVQEPADTSGQAEQTITLDGTTATGSSDSIIVDGGVVTINAAGTYRVSGTLTDGQVVVNVGGDGVVRRW